jgi:hypothetical protein
VIRATGHALSAPPCVVLLESVFAQSVSLQDALCRGRADLFDGCHDDQAVEAIGLCQRCPELERCRVWADSLPDSAMSGVVAGRPFVWASHPTLRQPEVATA